MNTPFDRGPWPAGQGEMARRIRAHEWAATPLGPIMEWPQSLRTAVDMVLAMPGPATILWGPRHVQIYNDAYTAIARNRHPALLGRPVAEGWPDAFDTVIAPLLDDTRAGHATRLTSFSLPLEAPDGRAEERVFDTDWSPIREESGAVAGTLQTLVETTDRLKAQAALRESEARHRLLIGSWAQAVWETDASGVVVADSPSWRASTGQTLEEWLGYGWLNAIHADDRACAERQWREAVAARGLLNAEFRVLAPGGGWRWTNVRAAPVLDAEGRVAKWAGMNIDIDERKQREADLARVQRIGGIGGLDIDVASGLTSRRSLEYRRLHGLPSASSEETHEQWRRRVHPEDRERAERELLAALNGDGESYNAEYRIVRPSDGAIRWIQARADIERDQDGSPLRLVGAHFDVTEQKRTLEALAASDERLRGFGEASTDVLWIRDAGTLAWTYLTPAFETIYGLSRDKALAGNTYSNWTDLIVEDDRAQATAAIDRVRTGERVTFEYRVRRPSDGAIRWLRNTDFPIRDGSGAVVAIGGIGHDVTDEKEVASRMEVLVAELQHRTRNLVGVVRAMANRTADRSSDLQDFLPAFRERLGALSRINGLLSKLDKGARLTFDEMLRTELTAMGFPDDSVSQHVVLDGPAGVSLRSATVQTFALAIHELTTNAVKYGALSNGSGRLHVSWRLWHNEAGAEHLHVEWLETGVADMPKPEDTSQGGGYGRMLIEKALPYQLGATTTYENRSDGIRCTIDLPLR